MPGVAGDEIVDTRPWRKSAPVGHLQPEFAYLPRKFKIALNGALEDRVVVQVDIGLDFTKTKPARSVSACCRRRPGPHRSRRRDRQLHPVAAPDHLLRVDPAGSQPPRPSRQHLEGRIKILVKALGADEFCRQVEEEWALVKDGPNTLTAEEAERIATHFDDPDYADLPERDATFEAQRATAASRLPPGSVATCVSTNAPATPSVVLSQAYLAPPGDITADQMDTVADRRPLPVFGEARMTHEQNVKSPTSGNPILRGLADCPRSQPATPNIGLLTDIIACPIVATSPRHAARSILIAEGIQRRFDDLGLPLRHRRNRNQ